MTKYTDVTKLKKQIFDFKRNVSSINNDYLIGYISALSVVEGMLAELPSRNLIEVVCPYYHLDDCSAMPSENISAFINSENQLADAKAEAIKEFAERVKQSASHGWNKSIDRIAAELTGDNK